MMIRTETWDWIHLYSLPLLRAVLNIYISYLHIVDYFRKMAAILEAMPCESCHNIELSDKRNKIASIVSGFLFFSGWWFAIDASSSDYQNTRDVFHLCGVFSALSMFMVNTVSNDQLRGEGLTDGVCGGGIAPKMWFFFAFLMGFG